MVARWLLPLLLLLVPAAAAAQTEKPAVDAYGDPLPPGAVARFGTLALLGNDPCCQLWDPVTGALRTLWDARERTVDLAAFSPDGKTLALALDEGEVVLLRYPSAKEIGRVEYPGSKPPPVDVLSF